MSSLNKVMLIGNLGADPEVRSFQNGGAVCNLRIATAEKWKDKNTNEAREKTEWHSVSIFSDGLIKVAERYLRKGSKVFIEGKLQTRKWQDNSGNDRYSTEVVLNGFGSNLVMLGDKSGSSSGGRRNNNAEDRPSGPTDGGYGGGSDYDDLDDDIPF